MKSSGDCGIPDNPGMTPAADAPDSGRLLIPYASALAPECQALLPSLQLPNLRKVLRLLPSVIPSPGTEWDFSTPAERALAYALGITHDDCWPFYDGCVPWAAASQSGTDPHAWFTPCHFDVRLDRITVHAGERLRLSDDHSRALFDALTPLCPQAGITIRYLSPDRWLASGQVLRHLRCASLDRINGHNAVDWMLRPREGDEGSQQMARLQAEAQMLFHTLPVNDEREAMGLPVVNGFWVHGAGALECAIDKGPPPTVPDTLRQAALNGDWAQWKQSWLEMDATHVRKLLGHIRSGREDVSLTLCGERNATQFSSLAPPGSRSSPFRWKGLVTMAFMSLMPAPSVANTLKDL